MNKQLNLIICFLICSGCLEKSEIKSKESAASSQLGLAPCVENQLTTGSCLTTPAKFVTSISGSVVTTWGNPLGSTSVTAAIPEGFYSNQVCTLNDSDLTANNIKSGINIFGVSGTYAETFQTTMTSTALRSPGSLLNPSNSGQQTSNQISLFEEQNTYVGADLPTAGGYNYRDIPDPAVDDDGTEGITCEYSPRPSLDCGTIQNTLASRIADCASKNPTMATWNGNVKCNRAQGVWKLVTRSGANNEVWQDQRTGYLWSSSFSGGINWCQASGNTQHPALTFSGSYNNTTATPIIGTGTISGLSGGSATEAETVTITFTSATTFTVSGVNCGGGAISGGGLTTTPGSTVTWSQPNQCQFTITQGAVNFAVNDQMTIRGVSAAWHSCFPGAASGLQPASPESYCAESASLNPSVGENWGAGVYLPAKGGMGKTPTAQSPSVRWRIPTVDDFTIAFVNGIRFVMPDMGVDGPTRPRPDGSPGGVSIEWTATTNAFDKGSAWRVFTAQGFFGTDFKQNANIVRCVGR